MKIHMLMLSAISVVGASVADAQQGAPAPAGAPFLTTTIENIGRPYDVLDGACVHQLFAELTFRGDPMANAITQAFRQMEQRGRAIQADALVGFTASSTTVLSDKKGVLLCGTLVKFRR